MWISDQSPGGCDHILAHTGGLDRGKGTQRPNGLQTLMLSVRKTLPWE